MHCPKCKGKVTVGDTVHVEKTNEIYRKRKCLECGNVFFTIEFEVDDTDDLKKIWSDNHRANLHYREKTAVK